MGARLISLFGISDYRPVKYEMEGGKYRTKELTGLMPKALLELIAQERGGDPDAVSSIVVLGTREARENYDNLFGIEASPIENHFTGRFTFQIIGKGDDEEGYREVFQTLVGWLRPGPIDEQLLGFREEAAPDEIILDITHGLKPQALIAGTAMTFVLAEAIRTPRLAMVPLRVVYGRYDQGDEWGKPDFHAPVWDLTQFVSTTLWTLAIQGVRYGRADAADVLARQEARRRVGEARESGLGGPALARHEFPRRLGAALRAFADSLTLLRAKDILTDRARTLSALLASQDRADLVQRIPALGPLLEDLEKDVQRLESKSGHVLDESGLRAMAELASFYGRIERFAEQAATLREAYLTLFGLRHPDLQKFIEPGTPGARERREEIARCVPRLWAEARADDDTLIHSTLGGDFLRVIDRVRNVCNNILHLSLGDDQGDPQRLRAALASLSEDLLGRVGPPDGHTENGD